jgi:energy-coupling factor transporter ATP-binding protein EcfA2
MNVKNQASLFDEPEIIEPVRKILNTELYPVAAHPGIVLTIRGTNGSGKSTLMRRIFELLGGREPRFIPGRSNPYLYEYERGCVLGSYESMAGGCDTIRTVAEVYELVKLLALSGRNVIFEGLLHSCDVIHTEKLPFKVNMLYLSTSKEECIEIVKRRRIEGGNQKEFDPSNLSTKYDSVIASIPRVKKLSNAEVFVLSREDAFLKAKEILGL